MHRLVAADNCQETIVSGIDKSGGYFQRYRHHKSLSKGTMTINSNTNLAILDRIYLRKFIQNFTSRCEQNILMTIYAVYGVRALYTDLDMALGNNHNGLQLFSH